MESSDVGYQLNLWGTFLQVVGVTLSLVQLVLYDVRTSDPTTLGRWFESAVRRIGAWIRVHRAMAAGGVFLVLVAVTGSSLDDAIFGQDATLALRLAGSAVGYIFGFLVVGYLVPQFGTALEYLGNNLRTSLTATGVLFSVGVFLQFWAVWQYG